MSQTAALLLPMVGMVFLTFGVLFWMLKLRYRAVLQDGLDPRYFKLYGKDTKLPDYLIKVTQHSQKFNGTTRIVLHCVNSNCGVEFQ